jgi:hypothetical protein
LNRLKYFLILFFAIPTYAETLKSLALLSTAVLVVSDEPALQKKCKLTPEKISELSQNLKASVDAKIEKLKESDFKILADRAPTCEIDCSCNLYSLAFETKNKKNELQAEKLSEKASHETHKDRLHCMAKIKNICAILQKIK